MIVSPPRLADMMRIDTRAWDWGPVKAGGQNEMTAHRRMETPTLYADRVYLPCFIGDCFTIHKVSFGGRFDYPNPGYRIVDIAGRPQYEIVCGRRDEVFPGQSWSMLVTNHTCEPRHFEASLGLMVQPDDSKSLEALGNTCLSLRHALHCEREELKNVRARADEHRVQADLDLGKWQKAHGKALNMIHDRDIRIAQHIEARARAERRRPDYTALDELQYGGTVQQHKDRFGK